MNIFVFMSATLEYKELLQLYEQSQLRIIALEQQLAQLQKMIFGSRQERFIPHSIPGQLALDITAEEVATCSVMDAKKISYTRTSGCQKVQSAKRLDTALNVGTGYPNM